jgi:hypothetical protein
LVKIRLKRTKTEENLKKPVETADFGLTNTLESRKVDHGTVLRTRMNIGDSHRPATIGSA